MSQTRRIPRHFVLSGYPNGAPEEETYRNFRTIPDTTEQMEFNIRFYTPQDVPKEPLGFDRFVPWHHPLAGDQHCIVEITGVSAAQVGHQLALIGDEFNRTHHRKFEDTLLHLAHGVAISVFQMWNIIKNVVRSFGNILNNNWTKRIIGYGSWICKLPFRCLCQKLVPAAFLLVAFWWAMNYGLQN